MIMQYLTKGLVGMCVILIIITIFLWTTNTSVRAERDTARMNEQIVISANTSLKKTVAALLAEQLLAEQMRVELAQELEQIRRTTRATIDRQAREITQLRRDYETVADYHSAVAPNEHIDWVCQQIGSCPD